MDFTNMFGKIKEVQAKLKEVQENLDKITAEGESGGGMVKATVNGHKRLLKIEIEQSLLTPQDKEMAQDLIVAAVNIALKNVEVKSNDEIQKTTQGVLPNIPGFDFSKMM